MRRTRDFLPHSVTCETRGNGSILLRSTTGLGPVVPHVGVWLDEWAHRTPANVFLSERSGAGWRSLTYGETLDQVRRVAAALIGRGMDATTPILVISGNGIDHAILSLAAQWAGIPTVPLAEQYGLIPEAHVRLQQAVRILRPTMVYAESGQRYGAALALPTFDGIEKVASRPLPGQTPFDDLLHGDAGADLDHAHAAVGPETVAKILLTSGSTSAPKGVVTTQKMLCVNQAQLAAALPVLTRRPSPRVVDWLPWNHVFGGSHNFNMMLSLGGSLYIDDGKPSPKAFSRTVENLRLMTGTLLFNVPVGFQMLLGALQADAKLARRFFADLDLIFYAGASLPLDVWQGFEQLALQYRGEVPLITSSWGMTETAPSCLVQQEPTDRSGVIGVPVPDLTAKLIPDDGGRMELRVKGPNVMTRYHADPEKTATAFDEEGFLITGDAVAFVDPADPNQGLRFDGRIADEFKLLSGTWVRAPSLRLAVLAMLRPLAQDVVICGADRAEIGAMIVPDLAALKAEGLEGFDAEGALVGPALERALAIRLRKPPGTAPSMRITRAMVLAEPPLFAEGEVTAKGNLNTRRLLTRRAALLDRLYSGGSGVILPEGTP